MNNLYFKTLFKASAASLTALLAIVLSCFNPAQARSLSESEARQVAKSFFATERIVVKGDLQAVQRGARRAPGMNAAAAYYIYNAGSEGDGYVIVSGDDRAMPVLGYSDTGYYDPNNVPPAMQQWLDATALLIEALGEDYTPGDTLVTYAAPRKANATIKPLLTCCWDQDSPFNSELPNTKSGEQAVTGCVATAMAQVMYYHRWPSGATTSIPEYTTKSQSIYRPALPAVTFNWNSMKDFYRVDESSTAATAVAQLLLYCTQAVKMDFKDGTSSASIADIPNALTSYFRYSSSVEYLNRSKFSNSRWEQLVYSELAAKRPIIYRGETMSKNGHAFVCDGYDSSTGMFHFNWGWNGASNGYYVLTALKPQFQGIGSASGTEGYVVDQAMVIGIAPNTASIAPSTAMTVSQVSASTTSYSRSSSSGSFTGVKWDGRFSNITSQTRSFYSGWALFKGSTFIKYISNTSDNIYSFNNLQPNYGRSSTFTFTFDSSLENGTYRAYAVSQVKGTDSWEFCNGYDVNFVEITIGSYDLNLKVYGENGQARYSLNSVSYTGNYNVGKPLEIVANVNNSGTTTNDKIYLFVNDEKTTVALSAIAPGQKGDITFTYLPTTAGGKTLKFSLNEDGSNPFASRSITIKSMPEASLNMSVTVNNASTSASGANQIKGTTFSLTDKITNQLSTAYNEDVVVYLLRTTKQSGGSFSGVRVDSQTKTIQLAGNASTQLNFSFKDLIVGESYWALIYYYSNGKQVRALNTGSYKIVAGGGYAQGDVNGDGKVDVEDVNAVINIILKAKTQSDYKGQSDVNGDGKVDVEDVNKIINIILNI